MMCLIWSERYFFGGLWSRAKDVASPFSRSIISGTQQNWSSGPGEIQGTFNAERGITPGGPFSSLMFNACIDFLVREMDFFCVNTICLAQSLGQNKSKARYST